MNLPSELYKPTAFWSLGSASGIVFLVCNVLIYLYPPFREWKIIPLIISIIVSYIGVYFLEKKTRQDYILALFNAFLIFASATGINTISSQLPIGNQHHSMPPSQTDTQINLGSQGGNQRFFQMWY
jgi:hypothetical protein